MLYSNGVVQIFPGTSRNNTYTIGCTQLHREQQAISFTHFHLKGNGFPWYYINYANHGIVKGA